MTTDAANACPTCGSPGHSCTGGAMTDSRLIITNDGARKVTGPLRLPRQKNTIGRAGYVGNVQTYDPRHPDVVLVQDHADDDLEAEAIDQGSDLEQIRAGARPFPQEAADEAQAADTQDDAPEAAEAATAPPEAEREGEATVATAAPAKERKSAPEDKSRKGGTGSKK